MHVSGRVQGVGYRLFVLRKARRLGLTGFVRNLGDGRVEAEAEGERSKLRALKEAMARGPQRARVRGIEVEPMSPTGAESDFYVR